MDHDAVAMLMEVRADLKEVKALYQRLARIIRQAGLTNDYEYIISTAAALLVHDKYEKAREVLSSLKNPREGAMLTMAALREASLLDEILGKHTVEPAELVVDGVGSFDEALKKLDEYLVGVGEVRRQPGPDMSYLRATDGAISNHLLGRTVGYTLNTTPRDYAEFVENSVHAFAYARLLPSHQWRVRLSLEPYVTNPLSPPSLMRMLELVDELRDPELVMSELDVSENTFLRYYKTLVRYLLVHPDHEICEPTELGERALDDEEVLAEIVLKRGFWAILSKHPNGGSVAEKLAKRSVVNRKMKWKDEVDISLLVDAASDVDRAEAELPMVLAIHAKELSTVHLAARAGVSTGVAAEVLYEHFPDQDWEGERFGL
ncbi:hypothetical protein [Methanopyrus sp. KOL6]|uniref:hypothetical protein n=1 Tax=Methanopyrus sp. KOL6 TaxID=1937004 RepID=UPI000B4BFAD9|nr:hypothetical protein [Methanopyrus sp. KOL6]